MDTTNDDPRAALRRSVYAILIFAGTGLVLGRILAVDAVDRTGAEPFACQKKLLETRRQLERKGFTGTELEKRLEEEKPKIQKATAMRRPFLSANDRSRWCAVRALVEPDMRVEGAPYAIDKVIQERNWDTVDRVFHDDSGRHEKLNDPGHTYSSKPPLMYTLMAGEYWVIYNLTGLSLGTHPFEVGRFMLITINVPLLLIYFLSLAALVERFGTSDWGRIFVMAAAVFGTFLTSFAVVVNNHLVAAAFAAVALYAVTRIWFDGERRLRWFVLAGLASAMLTANEIPAGLLSAALSVAVLVKAWRQTLLAYVPAALLVTVAFFGTNWIAHHNLIPPQMHRKPRGVPGDNWYNYPGSYWNDPKGIDAQRPSTGQYALHVLVGHHGIFSLTPVWLLSIAGLFLWLRGPGRQLEMAGLVAGLSVVCLAFYIGWGGVDRNYGGMTCGFRWAFWLAPLWLVAMLPATDWMGQRRWTRALALVLLMFSALSVAYPTWNPWTHPWLMDAANWAG